ncbi:MAG TPA: hypothetical protein VHM02_07760 [Thermoanaerobaculia bacterium]|nr:hypothetical protein [Thermoanaerobaculia bacterium]
MTLIVFICYNQKEVISSNTIEETLMRNLPRSATLLVLSGLIAVPGIGEALAAEGQCHLVAPPSGSESVGRYLFVQGGRAYEVLQDSAAFAHLADKRLRHPERFVGMGHALTARGHRPTDRIVVVRSIGTARALAGRPRSPQAPKLLLQAQTTTDQNGQGEQIFWSWDDGDDSTWEGSQYVERYSDGAWITVDGQLDISQVGGDAIWATKTGGGLGIDPDHRDTSWFGPADARGGIVEALRSSQSPTLLRFAQQEQDPERPRNQEWEDQMDGWAKCVGATCAGCALGCMFTGPGYPGCYGACCIGGMVACALEHFFF